MRDGNDDAEVDVDEKMASPRAEDESRRFDRPTAASSERDDVGDELEGAERGINNRDDEEEEDDADEEEEKKEEEDEDEEEETVVVVVDLRGRQSSWFPWFAPQKDSGAEFGIVAFVVIVVIVIVVEFVVIIIEEAISTARDAFLA